MADVLKIVADACTVHDYRLSANTPEFPTVDWLINPDLTNVVLPEITDVTTVADVAGSLGGKYFLLNSVTTEYYVWIDVDDLSTDPAPSGKIPIEVDITANATANDVASAVQAAVNSLFDFSASVVTNTVTITNTLSGDVTDASDVDTGFTINITQQGKFIQQTYWKVVDLGGSVYEVQEKTTPEKEFTDICTFEEEIIIDQIQDAASDTSWPISFIQDKTRGFKTLSTSEFLLEFSKPVVGDQDWVSPQNRIDSLAAYTVPYDSTIVASATHVVDTDSSDYDFNVFINGIDSGKIAGVTGTGEQEDTNVLLDIDVTAGDLIRVKAFRVSGIGDLADPITKLLLKWRRV